MKNLLYWNEHFHVPYLLNFMFLEKLDPNWKAAALHGKASCVGMIPKKNESHPSGSVCKCCLNLVYKDPIPLG